MRSSRPDSTSGESKLIGQKTRDAQFAEVTKQLQDLFHYKNPINADSYLSIPRTEENAFYDVSRKYERLREKLKIPEADRSEDLDNSIEDDIQDLTVYLILFRLWRIVGTRVQ